MSSASKGPTCSAAPGGGGHRFAHAALENSGPPADDVVHGVAIGGPGVGNALALEGQAHNQMRILFEEGVGDEVSSSIGGEGAIAAVAGETHLAATEPSDAGVVPGDLCLQVERTVVVLGDGVSEVEDAPHARIVGHHSLLGDHQSAAQRRQVTGRPVARLLSHRLEDQRLRDAWREALTVVAPDEFTQALKYPIFHRSPMFLGILAGRTW